MTDEAINRTIAEACPTTRRGVPENTRKMGGNEAMTDQQVIEQLAGRLGFKPCSDNPGVFAMQHATPQYGMKASFSHMSDLLTSRDALAPVLEGLSEGEWGRLVHLWGASPLSATRYFLTLPPRDLAFAIAEALEETQL
jgi:hypothetical protein